MPGNTTASATTYPQIAGFSSRGPSRPTRGDILKPDIAAPGVNVLAATSPDRLGAGRSFDFLSGTSMAVAAHRRAGGAVQDEVPDLVADGHQVRADDDRVQHQGPDGSAAADPFAQGAGQVDATTHAESGAGLRRAADDWFGVLEGLGVDTGPASAAIDPSDYNQASIAVGDLVGTQTITRRVTAVTPGLYRATVAVPGFRATVSPSILIFNAPGETTARSASR